MAFIKFGDGGFVNATEAVSLLESWTEKHMIGRSTFDFYSSILLGTLSEVEENSLDAADNEGCVSYEAVQVYFDKSWFDAAGDWNIRSPPFEEQFDIESIDASLRAFITNIH